MLSLLEKEKKFIKENIKNPDDLINSDDVNLILDPLDELILEKGFDENYDLNDFGREVQNMYDNIYNNN